MGDRTAKNLMLAEGVNQPLMRFTIDRRLSWVDPAGHS
jgi:hypothetical protein